MKNVQSNERGFTLPELLVGLVIVSLIAALTGPKVLGYLTSSKIKMAQVQISSFQTSLELYSVDTGRFPTTSEGLEVLWQEQAASSGWAGPYMQKSSLLDPWGNRYDYVSVQNGRSYTLRSFGADGHGGGHGDDADIMAD